MRILQIALFHLLLGLLAGCGGGTTDHPAIVTILHVESDARSPWALDLAGRVPGLVQLSLEFLNGDHHVSNVAAGGVPWFSTGPDLDAFLLKLSDDDSALNDPPDRVAMSAAFMNLGGISDRHVAHGEDLQGVARLALEERLAPGEIFVLSGFEFQTDGSNHHIRVLRITPFADLGEVEVEYRDDSPDDDHYEATILYAVVPTAPASETGSRPSFSGPFEESFWFRGAGAADRRSGIALLYGFSFSFRVGDRHLEALAIDLDDRARIHVTFADQDVGVDDLVDARVSYVLVEP